MFGIDIEMFISLQPGLLVVIIMAGVMTLVLIKVMQLMNHSDADGSKQHRITV